MSHLKFTPLQIIVHIAAWLPLAWLVGAYLTDNLTVNPVQAATQWAGRFAITLLVLSLACTPLNTLFGWREVTRVRRALGLYAFMYAALHFTILIGLDYGFALDLAWLDLATKPYILASVPALLILTALAATSFKWAMKRLGKNWKRLHRLVYVAGVLAVIHYAWAKKGNLFTLSGDILPPLIFGLIVAAMLLARVPVVKRAASRLRASFPPRRAVKQDYVKRNV